MCPPSSVSHQTDRADKWKENEERKKNNRSLKVESEFNNRGWVNPVYWLNSGFKTGRNRMKAEQKGNNSEINPLLAFPNSAGNVTVREQSSSILIWTLHWCMEVQMTTLDPCMFLCDALLQMNRWSDFIFYASWGKEKLYSWSLHFLCPLNKHVCGITRSKLTEGTMSSTLMQRTTWGALHGVSQHVLKLHSPCASRTTIYMKYFRKNPTRGAPEFKLWRCGLLLRCISEKGTK